MNYDRNLYQDAQQAFNIFVQELDQFITSNARNQHVYGEHIISVYVRKAIHMVNGKLYNTFDIGSISIDPEYQNLGMGSKVIEYIHNRHSYDATFVESILNERLYTRLKNKAWIDVEQSHPKSVVMFKNNEQPKPKSNQS